VVFITDLWLNLAPKFIEEVHVVWVAGSGTWTVKSWWWRVHFWVYSATGSEWRRTVVVGSWWRVGREPVVSFSHWRCM